MLRFQFCQQCERLLVAGLKLQSIAIAYTFGIRLFPVHHNRDVGAVFIITGFTQLNSTARRGHGVGNALVYSGRPREIVVGHVRSLPGHTPAAGLQRDIVGAGARHQNIQVGVERQYAIIVFKQHQALAHRFAGEFAMLGAADAVANTRRYPTRRVAIEQPCDDFDPQNTQHRVIQPLHGNRAVFYLIERIRIERAPIVGHHNQIHACVDRLCATLVGATGHLAVAVPVAYDEPFKAHTVFENIGQQIFMTVEFFPVPRREARHNRLHARGNGRRVTGVVYPH